LNVKILVGGLPLIGNQELKHGWTSNSSIMQRHQTLSTWDQPINLAKL